jgi:Tol biopolymer transport system component
MNKSIVFPAIFVLAALVLAPADLAVQSSQSADALFGAALHHEEVEGDYEKAIETYKKLLAEFSDNRPLAARAQFRIGVCYEKLGLEEAEKAFQKVLDNFPDQKEAVKQAREKLSLLQKARAIVEKEDQGIKMTKIPINREKYYSYTISPDGKKLANLTRESDIWITDIASGEEVQITHTGLEAWFSWAPDSQKLVSLGGGLKLVSVQGGTPKILIESADIMKEHGTILPTSWSLDSQYINCWSFKKGLFTIPIFGGEWKEILSYSSPEQQQTHWWPVLSPNEEFLFYSDTTGNKDIYIVPAEGGEPVQITNHPARDAGHHWSYDGRWLLFVSNRNGKNEYWIIGITPDGKRKGDPFQAPLLSDAVPDWASWTREGQLAFHYKKTVSNIFVSNADGSEKNQLTNMEWSDLEPEWCPDGSSIAFTSDRGGKRSIWLMSAQGSHPKKISGRLTDRPGVSGVHNIAWHPNGRIISCVVPQLEDEDRGIWTIDIESGSAQRIPFDFFNLVQGTDWSPDGKRIAFCFFHPDEQDKNPAKVYTISAEGGEAEILTKVEEDNLNCGRPLWSPDGRRIAFSDDTGRIWIADSEGGDPQAITDAIKEKTVGSTIWGASVIGWSPDGENVFFWRSEGKGKWGYYSVPSQGGELKKLNIEDAGDISPDGKKFVYSKVMKRINQYWLLENFLPVSKNIK